MATALALRARGHDVSFVGDRAVARTAAAAGAPGDVLPSELDLGPKLAAAIREAMDATGGDADAGGPIVERRLTEWAARVAQPVRDAVAHSRPAIVVTSLFGIEPIILIAPPCPWVVVNSTFYLGPGSPRPLREDVAPRAVALLSRFAALMDAPSLVLHATDPEFDLGFDGLPPRHHYAGPLGVWEPRSVPPPYLGEPGEPWVLVLISSQLHDDVALADAAVRALAEHPLRVVLTLGPDHAPEELAAVPPNVRVERTVSHAAVLQHGALLVSHAGHGSVMKALWHGRPMVLVPWGRDQPGVAFRAARLGVAKVVRREEATPESLSAAIVRVLGDEQMAARAARHGQRLRATDPSARAAELVESVL